MTELIKVALEFLQRAVAVLVGVVGRFIRLFWPFEWHDLGGLGRIPSSTSERDYQFTTVMVFFATDRNRRSIQNVKAKFGDKRSRLRYGTCTVSIPGIHQIGELEAPSFWRRLEFRELPWKHVVLLDAKICKKDDFFAELTLKVKSSRKKHAFLFIHGFNVTFEDAARRTAQMANDLEFDGAPVFYSWPSRGKTIPYTVDEQSIEWTWKNVRTFLEDFLIQSNAENVYLIAHSMGNRALVKAVNCLMVERPDLKNRITEIILTAPDIDAEVFMRDIAPEFAKAGRPVTLYASSNDVALAASKRVHGYARAGDSGPGLVITFGIETIDASDVDTDFFGHMHMSTRTVLSDISYLIGKGLRPDERYGLNAVTVAAGRYWVFRK